MHVNHLGDFLRACRDGLRPEDVGMASHGLRRVAGLRREEVAVLAGVNADYYTRLEQGRERHPSAQVLEALGGALRLDADARAHLYRLAGIAAGDRPSGPAAVTVSPALRQLMDGYTQTPTVVLSRTLDFLAANALCDALYAPFEAADNLARMVFADSAARQFFVAWDRVAEETVAHLRLAVGFDPDSPRLGELVRSLSEHSPDFARLWNAHAVRAKTRDDKSLLHPDVGPITLTYQVFEVRETPGQQLVIYHAEPGSPSAEALHLLGSLHATRRASDHRPAGGRSRSRTRRVPGRGR